MFAGCRRTRVAAICCAALDYCVQSGIDVACLGFGCERGSAIVEQRIAAAKQQGVAMIAAAGNLPELCCSRPSRRTSWPWEQSDKWEAIPKIARKRFRPRRPCRLRRAVCAAIFPARARTRPLRPGVAIVACQSPDGYSICDGTSLASAHVTALAALILASPR